MTTALLDPIFVNRRIQLELFRSVIGALARGERRHIALFGLRRIGKTVLLDEVRDRHPEACIVKLSLDTIVSTPEGFALDFVAAVLRAVLRVRGNSRPVTTQVRSIATAAGLLGENVVAHVDEILELVENPNRYGQLLTRAFEFPVAVSDAIEIPILVVLDEFQAIRKLLNFPGTDTLWASMREALDRRGRVAYVIAGSIVTAMRDILHAGNDPLFSRFEEHDLPAFAQEDSHALASGLWERYDLTWDQNAVQRIHTLSQGFPFYAHILAVAASDVARMVDARRVLADHVDDAFDRQMLDRDSRCSIYMQYLFGQAVASIPGEGIPDGVLRSLAAHEGRRASDIARSLRRRTAGQVHDVVRALVSIDILRYADDGTVWFMDPLLPIWLAMESERQESRRIVPQPRSRPRVVEVMAERIRALQEAAGPLFERRVHNVIRQFRGQTVSAKFFGAESGQVTPPTIENIENMDIPDPEGLIGGQLNSRTEVDGVTSGSELWLVEAKHLDHAVTTAMVDRLISKRRLVERSLGRTVDRLWIVSNAGFRTDAREQCERLGIYMSGSQQLSRLERVLSTR